MVRSEILLSVFDVSNGCGKFEKCGRPKHFFTSNKYFLKIFHIKKFSISNVVLQKITFERIDTKYFYIKQFFA